MYVKRIANVTQHFTELVYCLSTVAVSKNIKNWHHSHDETHSSLNYISKKSNIELSNGQPPSAEVDGLWANAPVLSVWTTICIDTDNLLKQP